MKEVFEEKKRCDEVLTVKEYLKIKTGENCSLSYYSPTPLREPRLTISCYLVKKTILPNAQGTRRHSSAIFV